MNIRPELIAFGGNGNATAVNNGTLQNGGLRVSTERTGAATVLNTGNVTNTADGGIVVSSDAGASDVTMTAGTVMASASGIFATSNTGPININHTGGSIGLDTTPAGRIGVNGILANSTSGTINILASRILATSNGILATTGGAGSVNVTLLASGGYRSPFPEQFRRPSDGSSLQLRCSRRAGLNVRGTHWYGLPGKPVGGIAAVRHWQHLA